MFYAPWCGHCKKKTHFLNDIVKNYKDNIQVHTYNCERLKDSDNYVKTISGFPTFKMGYKKKTHDIDLLEFIVVAAAITLKLKIGEVIKDLLENKNLNGNLKTELEHKKDTFVRKYNNVHL